MVSLFAEFIANDKPIIVYYKGELLFPVWSIYPRSKFGGFLPSPTTEADDPDEIAKVQLGRSLHDQQGRLDASGRSIPMAIARIKLESVDAPPDQLARYSRRQPNWLGTDDQGRDVLARVIYGFRISVLFGLLLTIFSSVDRRHGRRDAGLLRRPGRSRVPALPRDLVRRSRRCSC